MTGRLLTLVFASTLLSACAASPYDFPVPVMVDGQQATSMTGYLATDDENAVRARLAERMRCPGDTEFLSLETNRADNKLGTHILQYRAIMRCADLPAS